MDASPAFRAVASLIDSRTRPDELVELAELARLLCAEVDRLPDDDALFVRRCLFEGLEFQEASRCLGLSKSRGSRKLARAASLLGKRLGLAAR